MGLRSEIRKHTYGKQAFDLAAEGDFRGALALIDLGGNANYSAEYGFTGVKDGREVSGAAICNMGFIALEKGNIEALEGLLQRGLNPNATSIEGPLKLQPSLITFPPTMLELAINL